MSSRKFNLYHITAALILGGVIYILLGKNTYINAVFPFLSFQSNNVFCTVIRNYGADFLWGYALTETMLCIFAPKKSGIIFCGLTSFFTGFSWELLQYFKIVSGTADMIDCICYLAAAVFALINQFLFLRRCSD